MEGNQKKDSKPLIGNIYKLIILAIAFILIARFLYMNSSLYFLNWKNLPFSLHLNTDDLYLQKGEEFKLFVYGINQRVSYSSTNFRVAGVNFNGRVFGYNTGKAFIIAKVRGKEIKCRVHVIDINHDSLKLKPGETKKLKVKGTTSFVSWKSSNNKVATVSMFGKVTAKKKGTAVIYGKVKGKTLKCTIRVP